MELIGILGFFTIAILLFNKETDIESFFASHCQLKKLVPVLVCFIISLLFAVKFSLYPFNSKIPGTDSSVFLYIGRAMYGGAVPYKDLFDHKGIILYFIEYIGYVIGFGNSAGVWIFELLNTFATAYIFYLISKLFSKSDIVCYVTIFAVLFLSSNDFFTGEGGNLTEEYALPWIALSLYLVANFFIRKKYKPWHIILIGLAFSVVFFLRVNMVGLWGALLLVVIIYFVKNNRLLEVFKCAGLFILGCLIVVVPIVIYLLWNGALQNMIDYYFVFNFSYTDSESSNGILYFFIRCVIGAGISVFFIVYAFITNCKCKVLWLNAFALFTAFLSADISGRGYYHYGIILIPFFVIPAVLSIYPFFEKTREISKISYNRKILLPIITVCLMCVVCKPMYDVYITWRVPKETSELDEYLASYTNKDDDVLILNNDVVYYINSNRSTNNKFFYQQPPIDISDRLFNEFIQEMVLNSSDYIITRVTDDKIEKQNDSYIKVINFLNKECENRKYRLEKYDSFQVYVKE